MTRTAPLLAALTLAACQQEAAPPSAPASAPPAAALAPPPAAPAPAPPQASDDWRGYAKPEDADRLKRMDAAWAMGLGKAREAGHGAELETLGALADPKGKVLAGPHPAPGDYRCRTFKLGGSLGFISYPWFRCRVELTPGGDLRLIKLTGSQRTEGSFYPDEERRLVYLGAQAWGSDETRASRYGDDPKRDQIGVLERVGDQRWRLVLPWPRLESDLDLVELAR